MSHLPTNKTMIYSLISAIKQKVEPHILYETLRKMEDDLVLVYSTVLEGPLAAVDGNALFNLNAANLTGGPIPRDVLGPVAFLDEENVFLLDNYFGLSVYIVGATPTLHFGIGDVTVDPIVPAVTYLRMGQISDTRGFISQNLSWSGAAFVEDDTANGFVLDFDDGILRFHHFDSTDLFETWSFDEWEIKIRNEPDDTTYRFVSFGANEVFLFGEDAESDNTTKGYIGIPVKDTAQLPTASGDADAIIAIADDDATFVYYVNGNRFKLTGVAF